MFSLAAMCLSIEEANEGELSAPLGVMLCCVAMWVSGASHLFAQMNTAPPTLTVGLDEESDYVPPTVIANGQFIVAMSICGVLMFFTGAISIPVDPFLWLALVVGGVSMFVSGVAIEKLVHVPAAGNSPLPWHPPSYLIPPVPTFNSLSSSVFAVFLAFVSTYLFLEPHHHFGRHDGWSLVAAMMMIVASTIMVAKEVKEMGTDEFADDSPYDYVSPPKLGFSEYAQYEHFSLALLPTCLSVSVVD